MINVHASAVSFGKAGVLIRGPSGSGKSDLVLRLIDAEGYGIASSPLRAQLIADDQVAIEVRNDKLFVSPPQILAGKLEIRGYGIVDLPWTDNIALALVIDLLALKDIERMPKQSDLETEIMGISLPRMMIDPRTPSACARIRSFPFQVT